MNFTEVVNAVLDITKRPDRTTETQLAVNYALQHYVIKGEFMADLVETSIAVDSTSYGETLDISALVTRFRKFKYVKVPGVLGYLTPRPPEHFFQPSGSSQVNCYYMAGTSLTYVRSILASTLEVGYYQYAATLSGTDTHWMLDIQPFCVIDKAAARIFKSIGDMDAMRMYEATAQESFMTLIRDCRDQVMGG